MSDDTGLQVRIVVSRLFMKGFRSGFVAWWSVQLPLASYNVEVMVNDNAGSWVIRHKMDVGLRVNEPENY
jgi:hypothetical protein